MPGRPREFDESKALTSAMRLFWAHGYEACSISMLIKAMGLNRQSAYNTFGDKQQLFITALHHYASQVGTEMREMLGDDSASPLVRVRRFLKEVCRRTTQTSNIGCLLTNTLAESSRGDVEIRRFIRSVLEKLEDMLTDLLEQAIEQEELPRGKNPRQLARFLISIMQGSLVLSKADMSPVIRDSIAVADSVLSSR